MKGGIASETSISDPVPTLCVENRVSPYPNRKAFDSLSLVYPIVPMRIRPTLHTPPTLSRPPATS